MQKIEIGNKYLTLADFEKVIFQDAKIELSKLALQKCERSFSFLKEFSKDKIIYGVNTGFGPMAQYLIDQKDSEQLQYNLIRSHASGTGDLLSDDCVKATILARLNSLIQGYSGIHSEVLFLLRDYLNSNVLPCIYEHGGVGASGDLVQLAHLALGLIGEGEVRFENKTHSTKTVFEKLGLKPVKMYRREGLALLNGTSAMTGIGLINLLNIKRLLIFQCLATAMILELVEAYNDYFSEGLNSVKKHKGQSEIARQIREILHDSQLIKTRFSDEKESKLNGVKKVKTKVQEFYSLRCVPQILGPIWDTFKHAEQVLLDEFNSANDNPIIDAENENIFHGGNFHGDYVALEMDKLRIAVTKLSMLSERQLNFLLNDKLNEKLPPFVNLGKLGLNFGLQGSQYTAVSTVAENQTLATPIYTHSIPSNNDNQDIVSMGANSAQLTQKVIENAFPVLAIEFMAIIQAVEFLKIEEKMATATRDFLKDLKGIFGSFEDDKPKYKVIEKLTDFLKKTDLNIQVKRSCPIWDTD